MHRPNIPLEDVGTYREGMENEPFHDYSFPTMWLALGLSLVFMVMVFWPAIIEFFTPFKRGLAVGLFLGGTFGVIAAAFCFSASRSERNWEAVQHKGLQR